MKKLFLSFVALITATVSFAQSQIATLTHGDEIKTFYGPESFKEAMEAANHGDVITLSSGAFEAADITKAVTLRGAGMVELNDEYGFYARTVLDGNAIIQIEDGVENKLLVDGVVFGGSLYYSGKLEKPIFSKCAFSSITRHNDSSILNKALLVNCRVYTQFALNNSCSATCINSIINRPYCKEVNVNTSFEFLNCVLTGIRNCGMTYVSGEFFLTYSRFQNCYLNFDSGFEKNQNPMIYYGDKLSTTNVISNCCSSLHNAFFYIINPTNKVVAESDIFTTYTGNGWNNNEKFVLKEEAASTYLGDDGTQIGIYGGNMPYNERISMPRITKCNVANKSTADGKLSVDIQVEAAQ